MKKLLIGFLLLWGGTRAQAQPPFQDVNLVKDGSFEDTLFCPVHSGGVVSWMAYMMRYWGQETGSAIARCAYNSCDNGFGHPPIAGVPQNHFVPICTAIGNPLVGLP